MTTSRAPALEWVSASLSTAALLGEVKEATGRAHAFEPSFTAREVGKGTGLGLDISRRIVVERHSGEITIESGPGGTLVRVRLPMRHRGAS